LLVHEDGVHAYAPSACVLLPRLYFLHKNVKNVQCINAPNLEMYAASASKWLFT
jgi:hypothetical protein